MCFFRKDSFFPEKKTGYIESLYTHEVKYTPNRLINDNG